MTTYFWRIVRQLWVQRKYEDFPSSPRNDEQNQIRSFRIVISFKLVFFWSFFRCVFVLFLMFVMFYVENNRETRRLLLLRHSFAATKRVVCVLSEQKKTESECKRNGRTKTFAADTLDAAFTSYSIAHGTGKKRSHRKWRRLPCITVLVNFYYIFILNDVKKERWNTHTQRQCHLIAAAKKCAKTGTNRKKNWCVCVWVLCAAFRIWFEAKCGREKSRKKWTKISLSVNASLWTNADKNWQLWNFKWNATKPAAADRQSQCE